MARKRCGAALTKLVDKGGSQRIVVFTSGGSIATLEQHVLGMTDPQEFQLNWSLVNSAATNLMFQAGSPGKPARVSVSYLNNFSHLERPRVFHSGSSALSCAVNSGWLRVHSATKAVSLTASISRPSDLKAAERM